MTPREILIDCVKYHKPCWTNSKIISAWEECFENPRKFVMLCSWDTLSLRIRPYYPGFAPNYSLCAEACYRGWDFSDETKALLHFLTTHIRGLDKEIKMEDFL